MEQFDKRLKAMAEKEGCAVPEGFDARIRETLDALPPRRGRRRLGAAKGALAAAAACVLLVGTAFAASPGLQELLADALGGFAPYAQVQDGGVYVWNGYEFEVLSALADENTIRVYTRITDLEGQGRLDIGDGSRQPEWPWLDIYVPNTSVDVTGGCGATSFGRYDGAAHSAIAVTTLWGQITDDLTGAEVRIDTAQNRMDGKTAVAIPLDVEVMSSRTLFQDQELGGIRAEEVRISPLGITVISAKGDVYAEAGLDAAFRVCLRDGTQIETERGAVSGHGVYKDLDTMREYVARIWNFTDPVELDQIAGIYVGEDYFPVK